MLWDTYSKRMHPLHRVCAYQGSFPPQLPAYFLDQFPKAEVVLDPFCGRGTTLLEAVLHGRQAYGTDLSPLAILLSNVKTRWDSLADVLSEIEALDLSRKAPAAPSDVEPFYHPKTWPEVWSLRAAKRSDTLSAVACGKLHGHSPGFLSCTTFNVISIHGDSVRKQNEKHRGKNLSKCVKFDDSYRDVRALLAKAARKFIPKQATTHCAAVIKADARDLPLKKESIDLIITSPPFLDVIDYADVNWLRLWFLGYDYKKVESGRWRSVDEYRQFLTDVLHELYRVIRPGGTVVFEVGPVKRHMRLEDLVTAARGDFGLEGIVTQKFGESVSKISRAMGDGSPTTTMENRCVILRKG